MNIPCHQLHEHIGRRIDYLSGSLVGTVTDVASNGIMVSFELREQPGFIWHVPVWQWVRLW